MGGGIEQGSLKAGGSLGSVQIEDSGGNVVDPATETTLATFKTQSAFSTGAKSSIGASALQMTTSSIAAKSGVLVKAAVGNTGIVYVGASAAVTAGTVDATDGLELSAGDGVVIPASNANLIYVIASAAGQKVFWLVL